MSSDPSVKQRQPGQDSTWLGSLNNNDDNHVSGGGAGSDGGMLRSQNPSLRRKPVTAPTGSPYAYSPAAGWDGERSSAEKQDQEQELISSPGKNNMDYRSPYTEEREVNDGPPPYLPNDRDALYKRSPAVMGAWGFEILSIVFSLACLVGMIVLLSRIDNKPLATWPIPRVSANTLISILSTASRAAMILPVAESISQLKWIYLEKRALSLNHLQAYDAASRGPWGSLLFFFNARQFWGQGAAFLTFIGCIITIASIAMGPFAQQILVYTEEPTLVDGARSTVSSSQNYDWQGKGLSGVSNVMSGTRDGLVEAAAMTGLYDFVSDPALSCPGANCTYPTFTSLGIKASCADVTADTTQSCTRFNGSLPNYVCTHKLPGGYELQASAGSDAHNGFYHSTINSTADTLYFTQPDNATLASAGIVLFSNADLGSGSGVNTDWPQTLTAYECGFSVVAYAFENWTYLNGAVQPGSMRSTALNRTGMGPVIPFEGIDTTFPGNRTFNINFYDISNLAVTISTLFSPQSNGAISSYQTALYNSPNLGATIDNIARGMTYRMMSGPNMTQSFGEVYQVQTFMHVRWPWLVLTATLTVLAIVFFLVVMLETKWLGQKAWKSSMEPLLYGGEEVLKGAPVGQHAGEVSPHAKSEFYRARTQTILSQLR